ncbi:signal transduction histidine kinase/ActR/RegA family two-component response regulator [Oxalobacteraceae bacterium GrIS 2.11]
MTPSDQSHLEKEAQLQLRIVNLQTQVDNLQTDVKLKTTQLHILEQLRKANQHLVIAAMDARTSQAKAEADNVRQEEFLSMLAHELRNPLAPIVLATELIGKLTDSNPALPALHGIIDRQLNQLNHLVDDLLDASRISTGKITLQRGTWSLYEILEPALEVSKSYFEKRHQDLHIEMPKLGIVINGDQPRLTQVFSNLLINASKFTPEFGNISMSVSRLAGFAAISISDNGIGIPQNMQQKIFELFIQGFQTKNRPQGGLGIGLALAKAIVELHDGSMHVYSPGIGLGSEFIVQIPIAEHVALLKTVAHTDVLTSKKLNILLIEDESDTSTVLGNVLTQEGHRVVAVTDGMAGLTMAMSDDFDVLICDIGLPDMTGYELIERLRRQLSRPIPVLIALSGYNQSATELTEHEFDHYLVKPIKSPMLLDILSSLTAAHKL